MMGARKKILVVNAAILAALFGLVSLNKEVLRPALNTHHTLDMITGCLPNFLAGYLISLAFATAVFFRRPKYSRPILYGASTIVFFTLTIEEFRPVWGASTYFDSLDIIASAAGAVFAVLTYEALRFRRSFPKGTGQ